MLCDYMKSKFYLLLKKDVYYIDGGENSYNTILQNSLFHASDVYIVFSCLNDVQRMIKIKS